MLAGHDILRFVDDEAAANTLIPGATGQGDVDTVFDVAQWARLGARVWVGWIDSDSNPADGLSRDGCTDAWTVSQGWQLQDETPIEWAEIQQYVS